MTIPFVDSLDRATARGVTVRLLFDHLGTRGIPGTGTSRDGYARRTSSGT
jgi:hypothetical protein